MLEQSQPTAITQRLPDLAAMIHAYAVVVTDGRRMRRRVYLGLAAVEKAVHRARDRGDRAGLVLVRLTPVQRGEGR